jgi:excisionase family DNA binding protein
VAELLKLNQQTVRNWIDAGYLKAFHVGRRVRILRWDVEELLEESRIQPPARQPQPSPSLSRQAFWDRDVGSDADAASSGD